MELLSIFPVTMTEWSGVYYSLPIIGVILVAGLGTGLLFAISVIAFAQRRTQQYLLITVAIGALVVRTLIGLGTVFTVVPMTVHHLVGHGLDFLFASIILYAIYLNGPTEHRFSSHTD